MSQNQNGAQLYSRQKNSIEYTVGVKFLTELRGMLSVRWLSMLVPTGQQLTLIAQHYCGKVRTFWDNLPLSTVQCVCICVHFKGADSKPFHREAALITQQKDFHQCIRVLQLLKVVQILCFGFLPSTIHLRCLSLEFSSSLSSCYWFSHFSLVFIFYILLQYEWGLFCTALLTGPVLWNSSENHQESSNILDIIVLGNYFDLACLNKPSIIESFIFSFVFVFHYLSLPLPLFYQPSFCFFLCFSPSSSSLHRSIFVSSFLFFT